MNKERRKQISELVPRLEAVKELLDGIKDEITTIQDEEQEYYDSMPESFQQAERGSAAEEAVSNLSSAVDEIDNIDLDTIIESLNSAAE